MKIFLVVKISNNGGFRYNIKAFVCKEKAEEFIENQDLCERYTYCLEEIELEVELTCPPRHLIKVRSES